MLRFSSLSSVLYVVAACGLADAQTTPKNVIALSADLEQIRASKLADGTNLNRTVNGHFIRDSSGRTRLEIGTSVTIYDPVAAVTLTLDAVKKTATRYTITRPQTSARTFQPSATLPSTGTSLGVKTIEGFECLGRQIVQVIPAGSSLGNDRAIEKTTEIWTSQAAELPIQVTIADPLAGTLTNNYKNIKVGGPIDPGFFQVPPGFAIIDAGSRQAP